MKDPLRIYVAGPYSAPTSAQVEANVRKATLTAARVFSIGHHAFCPHAATHTVHQAAPQDYEVWMAFDLSVLERWANAILVIGSSPGADRELLRARELGHAVFHSIDEIPLIGGAIRGAGFITDGPGARRRVWRYGPRETTPCVKPKSESGEKSGP